MSGHEDFEPDRSELFPYSHYFKALLLENRKDSDQFRHLVIDAVKSLLWSREL